ncbi:META domain-containing protein [Saccharospirillum impatiens]|uniref:META domain-containing protein n=1 Tax=Saccharospirillum impatiens TaxID=169438 RepID=UPI0003F6D2F4|nr:META domain-containing protein [Saccharospirillum impatiens]
MIPITAYRPGWLLAGLVLSMSVNAWHPDTASLNPPLAESTIKTRPIVTAHRMPDSLTGQVFQWQYSLLENGSRVQPDHSDAYQLRFGSEGRISLRADCNHYAASARLTDTVFAIGPMIGTRALCPKGSLERPFINFIESASQWSLDGSQLTLRLPHDEGTMILAAAEDHE